MKRLFGCILASAISCATPSFAVPVGFQEATAAPAPAPDIAERRELVRRFFAVIQFDKMMNVMMESMMGSMTADPRIPAEKQAVVQEVALEAFAVVMPQIVEANVDIYAEAFTLDELQQLVAFYESPVGRSMMTKSVMLSRRAGDMVQRFQPIMEREMMTRLCARIDCEPAASGVANKRD
jgi:uncharacterized protein